MASSAAPDEARHALLMVWTNVRTDTEDAFNDWYNREHLRERVEVPGFIRARRYAAVAGSRKYNALYEAQSADEEMRWPPLRRA